MYIKSDTLKAYCAWEITHYSHVPPASGTQNKAINLFSSFQSVKIMYPLSFWKTNEVSKIQFFIVFISVLYIRFQVSSSTFV